MIIAWNEVQNYENKHKNKNEKITILNHLCLNVRTDNLDLEVKNFSIFFLLNFDSFEEV